MDKFMIWYFSMFLILSQSLLFSEPFEPWGKDAELYHSSGGLSSLSTCSTPLLGVFAEAMISFHQNVISPCDGPRSHYIPSSSQYALDAIRKYGFFQGVSMGCDRLMRENKDPWVYPTTLDGAGKGIKYDPVP
jgi:putative component of membrane protein insertase Oxa1/YidC/SpoIIIJ protein YidD